MNPQQDWNVTATTVGGGTYEGKVDRLGLMHHMLNDDGSGWLIISGDNDQYVLAARHIVSVVLHDSVTSDIDAAIEAYRGVRR